MTQYIVLPRYSDHPENENVVRVDNPEADTPILFSDIEKALDWKIYLEGEHGSSIFTWDIYELRLISDLDFDKDQIEKVSTWLRSYVNCVIRNNTTFNNRTFTEDAIELRGLLLHKEDEYPKSVEIINTRIDINKEYVGMKGMATMFDNGLISITLDNGLTIYGDQCIWKETK